MEKAIGIKNRYYTANNLGVGKWCIFNCHLLHFLLAKNTLLEPTYTVLDFLIAFRKAVEASWCLTKLKNC
jgi:hypothetical protein